jgi:hypothetical protein
MDYNGYILAVLDSIPAKEITKTDLTILRRLLVYETENGPFSVYKIYSYFKTQLGCPKSYKNTHQLIQKLYSLSMIEEVYGNYARGARFYRISTSGWLKLILKMTFHYTGYEQALVKYYDQNIFFKTFIFPYFEQDTIRYRYLKDILHLDFYLRDCCQETILFLRNFPKEGVDKEEVIKNLQSGKKYLLNLFLDLEVKAFLNKTVMDMANIDYYHPSLRKEVIDVLSRDKKFLEAIKEARNDFDSCYERLLHELR